MYCPKCGKENENDSRFCQKCGALLQQESDISAGADLNPIQEESANSYTNQGYQKTHHKGKIALFTLIPVGVVALLYVLFYFALLPLSNESTWMMGKKLSNVKFYHAVDKLVYAELADSGRKVGNVMLISSKFDGYADQVEITESGRYVIKGIKYGENIEDAKESIDNRGSYELLVEGETYFRSPESSPQKYGYFYAYHSEEEGVYLLIYDAYGSVQKIWCIKDDMMDEDIFTENMEHLIIGN